jgi:hypothetical protein
MTGWGKDSFFHVALSQAVSQCQWRPESPCGLLVGKISGSLVASSSFCLFHQQLHAFCLEEQNAPPLL